MVVVDCEQQVDGELQHGSWCERDEHRYVARTLEGRGRGTEIWTRLQPSGEARTEILSTEDPQAALGILYGLASVIHNGKLPEQARR